MDGPATKRAGEDREAWATMPRLDSENVELELEGMRYYYRTYPVGALQLGDRQLPDFRRNPDFFPLPARSEPAPILFVNGAWQPMDGWLRHAEYANRLAPVILLDPPGNGVADVAPAHYGLEFYESVLLQVLDAERVSRVNLLGFSYGTSLAVRLAQSHPDRVERVALVGTVAHLSDAAQETLRKAIRVLQHRQADDFAAVLSTFACPEADIPKRGVVDGLLRASLTRLTPEDYRKYKQNAMRLLIHPSQDMQRRLDAPTLVLTGEHDTFTPPAGGRELARACSPAAFTTIRQAGHFAPLENPRAVMDLALNFFRELPLDGVPDCGPVEYFGCDAPDWLRGVA